MAGNAREWVDEWYGSNYVGAPTDGSAWRRIAGMAYILRGGGYRSPDRGLSRSHCRRGRVSQDSRQRPLDIRLPPTSPVGIWFA
jgi:formylglycine-generating enzyme required for sulfatase activity